MLVVFTVTPTHDHARHLHACTHTYSSTDTHAHTRTHVHTNTFYSPMHNIHIHTLMHTPYTCSLACTQTHTVLDVHIVNCSEIHPHMHPHMYPQSHHNHPHTNYMHTSSYTPRTHVYLCAHRYTHNLLYMRIICGYSLLFLVCTHTFIDTNTYTNKIITYARISNSAS